MLLKKIKLNFLFIVFLGVFVLGGSFVNTSSCYGEEKSLDFSSALLASNKKSVYNTSRGDVLSNLNTSYYDGITASFYLDGELSVGYLMATDSNVFMHFGVIYPVDLSSREFGLGFIVDVAYSFGFTPLYELQVGGGGILWYASAEISDEKSSLFRLYLSPRLSNIFHITNSLAFNVDLLFSAKLYSSKDYTYVKRAALDLGVGIIYKL